MANEILIEVNRCTGCWTCAQACKAAYHLDIDDYRLFIRTIGGGNIDQAGGEWPKLYMKWNPVFTTECLNCKGAKSTGNIPYCVFNCPSGALTYGDPADPESAFSKRKEKLLEQGYHTWKQAKWEKTRDGVTYIEKGV